MGPNRTLLKVEGPLIDYMDYVAKRLNVTYELGVPRNRNERYHHFYRVTYVPEDKEAAERIGQVRAAFALLDSDVTIHSSATFSGHNSFKRQLMSRVSKAVDVLGLAFVLSADRLKLWDFTQCNWIEDFAIWSEKPPQQTRLFAFIRPFEWKVLCLINFANQRLYIQLPFACQKVWALIVSSFITTTLLLSFFSWFPRSTSGATPNKEAVSLFLGQYLFYNLGVLTNQGNARFRSNGHPVEIVLT